jgi:putative molybdopterin biosynthesis protein
VPAAQNLQIVKKGMVFYMDNKIYTPQDVADILKIKKNTVYEMIKRGDIKAKKLGKQLRILPSDVEAYVKGSTISEDRKIDRSSNPSNFVNEITRYSNHDLNLRENQPGILQDALPNSIILCGQDIVLDLLCNRISQGFGLQILRSYLGSYNGLYALYQRQVQLATAHLWDAPSDTYNLPYLDKLLPGESFQVYHLFKRMQGFYVAKGNPKNLHNFDDFRRNDLTFINRERGSGTRILLDQMLLKHNISSNTISGYTREVNSHLSALSVLMRGGADFALGPNHLSFTTDRLDFLPLKEESYDLIVLNENMTNPIIRLIIELISKEDFKNELAQVYSYDITTMGELIYSK